MNIPKIYKCKKRTLYVYSCVKVQEIGKQFCEEQQCPACGIWNMVKIQGYTR